MGERVQVEVGQRWRFRPSRGSGVFTVRKVYADRVSLRDVHHMRRDRSVSLRTLRGDYELVP